MPERITKVTWIVAGLMVAALVFSIWGWLAQSTALKLSTQDAIYRAVSSLPVSFTYQDSGKWNADWRIDLSRWLGLAAFGLGAVKVIGVVFAERFKRWHGRALRNHLIVVGNSPDAQHFAQFSAERKTKTNWILDNSMQTKPQQTSRPPHVLTLQESWSVRLAKDYGLARASTLLFATDKDSRNIALARQAREAIGAKSDVDVCAVVRQPWLAMRSDAMVDGARVRVISSAAVAARRVNRRHPPFWIAMTNQQQRIHLVIVGFSELGEAVLIDTLLSSLTVQLEKPLITIIDANPVATQSMLDLRYPELTESAEIRIIQTGESDPTQSMSNAHWQAIVESAPITAIYVCLRDQDQSLAKALSLQAMALQTDQAIGPIFTYQPTQGAIAGTTAGTRQLSSGQIVGFGDRTILAAEGGAFDSQVDMLAIEFHANYCATAPEDAVANVPWHELNEDLREANRRSVLHIAAVVASAGFDIEPWLSSSDASEGASLPMPRCPDFPVNGEPLERLATLEHERWMAERRVNGWQYASVRNNARRMHHDLVPFHELSDETKNYDRSAVRVIGDALRQGSGSLLSKVQN